LGERLVSLAQKVQVHAYLRKTDKGVTGVKAHVRFLGHDSSGNEIKTGGRVNITAGPDKGMSGTVTGQAQGGGITVELKQSLGKKRTAVVDPDELKVIRQFKDDKDAYDKEVEDFRGMLKRSGGVKRPSDLKKKA